MTPTTSPSLLFSLQIVQPMVVPILVAPTAAVCAWRILGNYEFGMGLSCAFTPFINSVLLPNHPSFKGVRKAMLAVSGILLLFQYVELHKTVLLESSSEGRIRDAAIPLLLGIMGTLGCHVSVRQLSPYESLSSQIVSVDKAEVLSATPLMIANLLKAAAYFSIGVSTFSTQSLFATARLLQTPLAIAIGILSAQMHRVESLDPTDSGPVRTTEELAGQRGICALCSKQWSLLLLFGDLVYGLLAAEHNEEAKSIRFSSVNVLMVAASMFLALAAASRSHDYEAWRRKISLATVNPNYETSARPLLGLEP